MAIVAACKVVRTAGSIVLAAVLFTAWDVDAATLSRRAVDDTGAPERFSPPLNRALTHLAVPAATDAPTQIDLVFHILSGPAGEGDLSDEVLSDQLAVVNDAYRESAFRFTLAQVRRYPASPYFAGGCFPTLDSGIRMKMELAVDPAKVINVYFCTLARPYIVGYGTLPDEFPENDPRHGVVVDYGTVPGSAAPLNLGHTLVHEIGHYLGLLHPFQGGCAEPGDGVADTPPEASAAFGCEVGRDTCAGDGADPVTNFMDYSDDACTTRFTPLQSARMHAAVATFRPNLASTTFSIGPGISGNWFNPAQNGHGFAIEVLPGGRMLAEWFVFAPGGGPTWIAATGTITGDTAVLQGSQVSGDGGLFPPRFDPDKVQHDLWGTIQFRFTGCDAGIASWQPVAAGYPSGSMAIQRVTTLAGLSCP